MFNRVVIDGDMDLVIPQSGEMGVVLVSGKRPYPSYEGETVVIPKAFEAQVLETANKTVYDDITVLEIPYTEVSNVSGGFTVSIG